MDLATYNLFFKYIILVILISCTMGAYEAASITQWLLLFWATLLQNFDLQNLNEIYIYIYTSGYLWPSDTVKSPGSPSMSWKSCAKKIPGPGSCEAPCVKSRSQNWDPTPWKSRPKSFQVSVLETASVKIQAPKLRSQVLKTMSWNFPAWGGYKGLNAGRENQPLYVVNCCLQRRSYYCYYSSLPCNSSTYWT